jgi:transcriptional regulator with XRE-family HTH domain
MNIEIANRLVKLRKEKGLSQEELADALGISRQAVSKWERAEASPDTDNLICLAKLYNVSLDSILDTDETIEDLKKEQEEKAAEQKEKEESFIRDDEGNSIHIGSGGIHLKDADGSEVHISKGHVRAIDKDGHVMTRDRVFRFSSWFEGVLMLLAVVAYLLLGSLLDMWASGWVVFLLPEIICSFIRCFEKKRLSAFNMPVLATFVFFLVCMVFNTELWHPMWVVFLMIPVYYSAVKPIDYKLGDRRHWDPKEDNDVDDDEDDN